MTSHLSCVSSAITTQSHRYQCNSYNQFTLSTQCTDCNSYNDHHILAWHGTAHYIRIIKTTLRDNLLQCLLYVRAAIVIQRPTGTGMFGKLYWSAFNSRPNNF